MNFFSKVKRLFLFKFKKKKFLKRKEKNVNLNGYFVKFKTDKSSFHHSFSKYYEKQFFSYKNKKINILEIGSAKGASAASFYQYFKKANIYCLDNHIENFEYYGENLFPILFDIESRVDLKNFQSLIKLKYKKLKIFDAVIEDKSHRLSHILLSIKNFFNCLKSKGFFVLEDYKFPNYFSHCRDLEDEYTIDKILFFVKQKKFFKSNILTHNDQKNIFEKVDKIFVYKGKSDISDICFIKTK